MASLAAIVSEIFISMLLFANKILHKNNSFDAVMFFFGLVSNFSDLNILF